VSGQNVTFHLAIVVSATRVSYGRGNDLVWAIVGACTGLYLFYRGFRLFSRKRLILDTPTSKIRSASLGLVEVSGLAVGRYTLPAPITGRPCYYYRTTAWQSKPSGKSNQWEKVADESLHLPFFLDDNTGKVLIDPTGAEMDIHRDFHEEYGTSLLSFHTEVPPAVDAFLTRHGVGGGRKFRIEEYCIKPKNALFILGTLAEYPAANLTSVAAPAGSTLPRKAYSAHQEVIRFASQNTPFGSPAMRQPQREAAALSQAGINRPAAWAAAEADSSMPPLSSSSGTAEAAASGVALEEFDPHPSVVLMKGSHSPAFFISWRSQRDVVQSLGWKSALMIWGGPALSLLSLYIVLRHFELL
jgi:hypothetical protein